MRGAEDDFEHPLQLLAKSIEFTDPVSGEARYFESECELGWDGAAAALPQEAG